MSEQLLIFPTPIDAKCELTHDTSGWRLLGVPATHPSGRLGQVFDIPDGTNQANGIQLLITPSGNKVPILQRGILHLNRPGYPYPWRTGQTAALENDDFHCPDAKVGLPRLVATGQFFAQDVQP